MILYRKNITSGFLMKIALILSLFVSTGYNNFISAIPREAVKTELILSEKFNDSNRTFSYDKSSKTHKVSIRFFSNQLFEQLTLLHNQYANLLVKARSILFLEFKESVFIFQTSNPCTPKNSFEDHFSMISGYY